MTHFKVLVACCSIMLQLRDCHKLVACSQGSAHTGFNWLTEQVLLVSASLLLHTQRPGLESSTTESNTWIAATSIYYT